MGPEVFEVNVRGGSPYLRLYAHSHPQKNDVKTLLALNIHRKESYRISFADAQTAPIGLHLLTTRDLFGKQIWLNNTGLTINGDSLPELQPENVQNPIVLPPCSYAFMTIRI